MRHQTQIYQLLFPAFVHSRILLVTIHVSTKKIYYVYSLYSIQQQIGTPG